MRIGYRTLVKCRKGGAFRVHPGETKLVESSKASSIGNVSLRKLLLAQNRELGLRQLIMLR